MEPKKSTSQFISEATAKFGDLYDYSVSEYVGSHKKIKIICRTHGGFEKVAREFLDKGRGCPLCATRQPMSTPRFIAMAREIHGDTFDYSKSICNAIKDRVIVTCKVPGHGDWEVKANNHLSSKSGCPKCAGNQTLGASKFIDMATKIHNGLYTYGDITYVNNTTPVSIICKKHGEFSQPPMPHLAGQGCPKCAGKGTITTESFIALSKQIHGDKFDYSLAEFKTTAQYITLKCKAEGHIFKQKYGTHIYQKSGCMQCSGSAKKTLEKFISDARKVHGDTYDYSLCTYVNVGTKVDIICSTHGVFSVKPNSHLRGAICRKCYEENSRVENAVYISRAKEVYSGKYTYERTKYIGSAKGLVVTCPEHGDFAVRAESHLRYNVGCPRCAAIEKTKLFITKSMAGHGDTYDYSKVSYSGDAELVTIICKKHGEFQQAAGSHLQGRGCPLCANMGPSKPQLEIQEFLENYTKTILEHKFKGSQKRFDIYLPEKDIAVEFNGLYWHSSRTQLGDRKELDKYNVGIANGVRTLIIFGDEWKLQNTSVKNMLLSAIGELPRVSARSCDISVLDSSQVRDFYVENHVLGAPSSSTHFGLSFKGELVACMSFGVLRSDRKNTDSRHWELTRFSASKTVVGGASRLLSAFLKMDLCDNLTSYSDVRMFSGKMYEKLGFSKTHQTPPDYHYVNTSVSSKRIHKARFQKKHLVKLFPGCDIEGKTEKQICEENGFYQIYDCGKIRWDRVITPKS